MKVLVTGGNGLVGCSLQKVLKHTKNNNTFIFLSRQDCELRDMESVSSIFEKHLPDIVVHLASHVGGVYDNMNNNLKYLIDNVTINNNIIKACSIFHVKKLICMLSTCIFPDKNINLPLTSSQIHNGLPHESNIGYAYSKRLLHVAANILSSTSQMDVVHLIPTNLYGEWDNYNIASGHVIPALIHKIYMAKCNNNSLKVMGTGDALRQFVYADDLAMVIIHFVNSACIFKTTTCIVSPPESDEMSIKEIVKILCSKMNFCGDVVFRGSTDTATSQILVNHGQHKKTSNASELLHHIPDFSFTSFDKGISNTIQFFQENYSQLRK